MLGHRPPVLRRQPNVLEVRARLSVEQAQIERHCLADRMIRPRAQLNEVLADPASATTSRRVASPPPPVDGFYLVVTGTKTFA